MRWLLHALILLFAVGVVSRYMENPGKKPWEAVKGIMRYLKGTKDLWIFFGKQKASGVGFTDVDFVGLVNYRKSTSRYVLTFTRGAVTLISRLYKCVALSTTEAEYVATTKHARRLYGFHI